MKLFDKLLIANRGEIAIRVMQSCKRLGIKTVAVYSEADTNALHVKEADEAVYIGPSPSAQSYLKIANVLRAIHTSGARAVHPGYGFLSENTEFAKGVRRIGATLIGPSAEAIKQMGDKIESKKIARAAGVSTVPGTLDVVEGFAQAKAIVEEIGYPVIIKAAAGGGGKGMRVVRNDEQLAENLRYAASEAETSFNDGRVFIEKFFDNPRHIEIQVLGDKHGNIVALGERECSIQRRHQKVIEEAPSTFLDESTRRLMGEQAVALARAVGYHSAGTVEFIVDDQRNFYFLEMNTRLQVEHRVTELITGIDLVEQMIRVAAGEKLPFTQEDITFTGWALESRVYAEDPKRGFLPSVGRITRYQPPEPNPHLLIDTGVYEGGEVSMFYDPMIAKVCTHAPTRGEALDVMRTSLAAFEIRGIAHNISFLEAVLAHPKFISGDISTHFIEQEYPGGFCGAEVTSETTRIFIGVAVHVALRDIERAARTTGQLPGRARAIGARWVVDVEGQLYPLRVKSHENGYDISYDEGLITVRSDWQLGTRLFHGIINGKRVSVKLKQRPQGIFLEYGGAAACVKMRTPRVTELAGYMPPPPPPAGLNEVRAPIAGLVSSIAVAEGDVVKAGSSLFVIEAMKMENVVTAERDAVVEKVHITAPESVAADQTVLTFHFDVPADA